MTIRNSIEYLVSKGLLEKRLGSGNYVKRTSLNLNLNEQLSFSEKSHFSDKTSRTEVIEFEKIYNSKISKIFNLDKDKEFFKIKRLRYLDEEVVNIEITYLLCEMFPDISIEIMEKSKYDYVENFITIKESFNKIIPIIPDMDTQKIFHIDSNTPIFYKTSLGLTTKNIIFEYSELYFNPKIYFLYLKNIKFTGEYTMEFGINIDIYKLGEKYHLTESEELALKYIVNNFEKSLEIGVRGVAKNCFASTSVVMNLAKKLGYKGFVDMVYRLEFSIKNSLSNSNSLNNYCTNLDDEKLKYFKNLISNTTRPIFIHGTGFSGAVTKYMADKLMVLGYYSSRSEYMETMEPKYHQKAILLVVSKSGETSQIIMLCEKANLRNVPIVLFTGTSNSTLENLADLTFIIKDSNPIDDRNLKENDFFGNTILFFEYLLSVTKNNN